MMNGMPQVARQDPDRRLEPGARAAQGRPRAAARGADQDGRQAARRRARLGRRRRPVASRNHAGHAVWQLHEQYERRCDSSCPTWPNCAKRPTSRPWPMPAAVPSRLAKLSQVKLGAALSVQEIAVAGDLSVRQHDGHASEQQLPDRAAHGRRVRRGAAARLDQSLRHPRAGQAAAFGLPSCRPIRPRRRK